MVDTRDFNGRHKFSVIIVIHKQIIFVREQKLEVYNLSALRETLDVEPP